MAITCFFEETISDLGRGDRPKMAEQLEILAAYLYLGYHR